MYPYLITLNNKYSFPVQYIQLSKQPIQFLKRTLTIYLNRLYHELLEHRVRRDHARQSTHCYHL